MTNNKKIRFTGEMSGTAEIITGNRSLMERFSTPVKLLTSKFFE